MRRIPAGRRRRNARNPLRRRANRTHAHAPRSADSSLPNSEPTHALAAAAAGELLFCSRMLVRSVFYAYREAQSVPGGQGKLLELGLFISLDATGESERDTMRGTGTSRYRNGRKPDNQ
jgi:hypothetical protein